MIYDCFTFFNELDLLEFRLKLLDGIVDKFVIAEANLTHSGMPKPYIFESNKLRYEKWKEKIIYIKVELSTAGLIFNENEAKYNPQNGSWVLENRQREALTSVITVANDNDMIMVGDLDEIPDPMILEKLDYRFPIVLSQAFHNYFLNCRNIKADKSWNGTVICSGKYLKDKNTQHLRDKRNELPRIKNGGWHFSYLGGVNAIKQKLKSFSHTEFNKEEFLDEQQILNSLEKGQDVLKRKNVKYRFVPLRKYPHRIRVIMKQYPQFLKELPFHKRVMNFFRF